MKVIVVGCGGFGSSTLFYLSKLGVECLGIEQHSIDHELGSSGGGITRMFRMSYFEHPSYVPLLSESYDLWRELGRQSKEPIFIKSGVLSVGKSDCSLITGTLASAKEHNLTVKTLTKNEIMAQYPGLKLDDTQMGIFEERAGFVYVKHAIANYLKLAKENGAQIKENEKVMTWEERNGKILLETNKNVYEADKVIFSCGPWVTEILKDLQLPITIKRKTLLWYKTQNLDLKNIPGFAYHLDDGFFYGFPIIDALGLKVAEHTSGEIIDSPDVIDRSLKASDYKRVSNFVSNYITGIEDLKPTDFKTCMYSVTPDQHFIIDSHPKYPQISFASGFSGHGFKFLPIVGKSLAANAVSNTINPHLNFLKIRTFT